VEASLASAVIFAKPLEVFPSAHAWIRAWVALAVAAIAIASIPASQREPWRPGRIRRLAWGAVVASILTLGHEAGVLLVAREIEHNPSEEPALGLQLLVTYVVILIVALALEPMMEAVRAWFERRHDRKTTPEVLLEHALAELNMSREYLDYVASRPLAATRQRGSVHEALVRVVLLGSTAEEHQDVRERAIEIEIDQAVRKLREGTDHLFSLVTKLGALIVDPGPRQSALVSIPESEERPNVGLEPPST
jgi:hypothetical protein